MTTKNLIMMAVAVLFILFYLYQSGYIFANFESVTPKEADEMMRGNKNSVVLLDVRTNEEYNSDGRIGGAVLIPVQNLSNELAKLQAHKDKKIFVYCRSGMRSVSAARILSNAGFTVCNIRGGITGWKNSGLEVKK